LTGSKFQGFPRHTLTVELGGDRAPPQSRPIAHGRLNNDPVQHKPLTASLTLNLWFPIAQLVQCPNRALLRPPIRSRDLMLPVAVRAQHPILPLRIARLIQQRPQVLLEVLVHHLPNPLTIGLRLCS